MKVAGTNEKIHQTFGSCTFRKLLDQQDLYKNAIQWDAYRPLVDPGGICQGGKCLPRGGSICPGGKCLLRGCLPRGCLLGVCGRHPLGPEADTPPPVDRETPVKTQPSQTSFAGGNKTISVGLAL